MMGMSGTNQPPLVWAEHVVAKLVSVWKQCAESNTQYISFVSKSKLEKKT